MPYKAVEEVAGLCKDMDAELTGSGRAGAVQPPEHSANAQSFRK